MAPAMAVIRAIHTATSAGLYRKMIVTATCPPSFTSCGMQRKVATTSMKLDVSLPRTVGELKK